MGFGDKLKNMIAPPVDGEEEEYVELSADEAKAISEYENPKTKGVLKTSDAKMALFEPRSFDEASDIADHLKQQLACVVNLHRLEHEFAQRTIDFLYGVVYALDGKIQRIGRDVILCTPKSVGVTGEIQADDEEQA
jgi:cell division inhibitor SepF